MMKNKNIYYSYNIKLRPYFILFNPIKWLAIKNLYLFIQRYY